MLTGTQTTDCWESQGLKTRVKHRFSKLFVYNDRISGEKNGKLVRGLQKLLLHSTSAKYLAVRQVTQLNMGKKTAGVDGKTALTPRQRLRERV